MHSGYVGFLLWVPFTHRAQLLFKISRSSRVFMGLHNKMKCNSYWWFKVYTVMQVWFDSQLNKWIVWIWGFYMKMWKGFQAWWWVVLLLIWNDACQYSHTCHWWFTWNWSQIDLAHLVLLNFTMMIEVVEERGFNPILLKSFLLWLKVPMSDETMLKGFLANEWILYESNESFNKLLYRMMN